MITTLNQGEQITALLTSGDRDQMMQAGELFESMGRPVLMVEEQTVYQALLNRSDVQVAAAPSRAEDIGSVLVMRERFRFTTPSAIGARYDARPHPEWWAKTGVPRPS